MGAIVITEAGMATSVTELRPKDVDREFVTLFTILDENTTPYLDDNIENLAQYPSTIDKNDDEFVESNLMHAMNGYLYANGPKYVASQGEKVRWYVKLLLCG